jgi:hypothetical protein
VDLRFKQLCVVADSSVHGKSRMDSLYVDLPSLSKMRVGNQSEHKMFSLYLL